MLIYTCICFIITLFGFIYNFHKKSKTERFIDVFFALLFGIAITLVPMGYLIFLLWGF